MKILNPKKVIIRRIARLRIEALNERNLNIPFVNNTKNIGETFTKDAILYFRRKPTDREIADKLTEYFYSNNLQDFSIYIEFNLKKLNTKNRKASFLKEIIDLLDTLIDKWTNYNLNEAKKKSYVELKPVAKLISFKEYSISQLVSVNQIEDKLLEVRRSPENGNSRKTLFKKELIFIGKILRDHYLITSPNQEVHINQFLQLFGEGPMKNNQGIANSIQSFDKKNLENIKNVLDEGFQLWNNKKNR